MNVYFVSLGCDKNLVDSEDMLGILDAGGYTVTDDEDNADIIIVNTCCFIEDAKKESINTILEMADKRKNGPCRALIVTGCMAQRYRKEIMEEIPEVDAIVGTMSYDRITEAIDRCLRGEKVTLMQDINRTVKPVHRRMLATGGHFAYLKIAEGCDKHCTYCVIPSVRGRYRSFPMDELVEEARDLAGRGVRELILIAQETTLYGTDLYGRKCLHDLIHQIAQIGEIRWIRVMYCYPEEIYPELVECMKTEPKFCHYLDLPIQHADDDILKRMARKTSREDIERIVRNLREQIPDICLRTTLITGFPGETEENHRELVDFVRKMKFDRLGVFTYSQEEGTPAAAMPDQIDEDTRERRRDEIMKLQQRISAGREEEQVGRVLTVMVEGREAESDRDDGEDVYVCRTYADAPDVDGYLFLETGETLYSGDFVQVRVTGANEYDLIGELYEAGEPGDPDEVRAE